jgi:hypothetical protein
MTPTFVGMQAQLLRRTYCVQREREERKWIRREEVLSGLGVEQAFDPDATSGAAKREPQVASRNLSKLLARPESGEPKP